MSSLPFHPRATTKGRKLVRVFEAIAGTYADACARLNGDLGAYRKPGYVVTWSRRVLVNAQRAEYTARVWSTPTL